ncbi:MiaB-like tRNA modifying enzyme YliG [Anaeromyxobacter sp. K]|uniref:Ribosomal protein uS12 methylthiotransferase RimO n=1 Tax=Anaeromyxobacter sp. (strain K) TaxID=447217 RepID=RIMO_ANASK|nr:30S ribosomal protein S12 methylthiotransferase RimO [Anaeromyxobacter sp. K]B4UKQ2.1 RecName: Full=Ribosomal protein uS12 methylthiotransferase RimO; Short=uS12 MTTase; Short=uS12 methylthiotransferase; AltName: Full=Ribosomal protein uS12 (aspartate-C(3))-methylthiotransferase; AltName: Full=Ribosome maturation factor RimO [Anaeromyxobacter sp. K]ACG71343.1 MiaB-like tRNA modifying enzyme YliG [Anaeromyxobacter sp. K]
MATRVYMHTLGCPKNRVDSEVMLGTLAEAGYRLVQDPAQAEVIVVNTCGFIESAKEESVEAIVELADQKREGRCRKLVVTGCLVQRHAEELARELPEVDHFLGTGAYQDVARIVSDAQAKRLVVPDPDFVHSSATPRVNSLPSHTAYLKIAEGCDNACAFCIIPKLRGGQRSRPIDDLVAEAAALAAQGTVELSLVAQDLTAYGQDLPGKVRLHHLLPELAKVDGIRWIRLHYAYPRDVPDALVAAIADEPRIVKYLDMPLQHSSDRLLRAMKRGRDSVFLRDLLARLRSRIPGLALRTALIVGLPGETEADFEDLLRFVEEQRFERLGVFEYSAEEGTPAAEMADQVPDAVKRERRDRIMAVQQAISRAHQQAMIGRRVEVLVEGRAEETEHLLAGRHAQQAPEIDGLTYINDGVAYPGEIVTVEITDAAEYDLVGRVVARDPSRAARPLPAAPRAAPARKGGLNVLR